MRKIQKNLDEQRKNYQERVAQEKAQWEASRAQVMVEFLQKLCANEVNFQSWTEEKRGGVHLSDVDSYTKFLAFDCSKDEFEDMNREVDFLLAKMEEARKEALVREGALAKLTQEERKALGV